MKRSLWAGVGVLLILTIVGKLSLLLGEHGLLGVKDPLLPFLTMRQMLFVAVVAEVLVMAALCAGKTEMNTELAVAWLATVFLAYRTGLLVMGYKGPCACMGNLASGLGLTPGHLDGLAKIGLAYMLTVAYSALFLRIKTKGIFQNQMFSPT